MFSSGPEKKTSNFFSNASSRLANSNQHNLSHPRKGEWEVSCVFGSGPSLSCCIPGEVVFLALSHTHSHRTSLLVVVVGEQKLFFFPWPKLYQIVLAPFANPSCGVFVGTTCVCVKKYWQDQNCSWRSLKVTTCSPTRERCFEVGPKGRKLFLDILFLYRGTSGFGKRRKIALVGMCVCWFRTQVYHFLLTTFPMPSRFWSSSG